MRLELEELEIEDEELVELGALEDELFDVLLILEVLMLLELLLLLVLVLGLELVVDGLVEVPVLLFELDLEDNVLVLAFVGDELVVFFVLETLLDFELVELLFGLLDDNEEDVLMTEEVVLAGIEVDEDVDTTV